VYGFFSSIQNPPRKNWFLIREMAAHAVRKAMGNILVESTVKPPPKKKKERKRNSFLKKRK